MKKTAPFFATLGLAISMTATSLPANAVDDYEPEQLIKYRTEGMNLIKHHNESIKLILQGKVPYDNELAMHMDAMGKLFATMGNWFPEGSDLGETNAKDGVWDNPEKFEKTVKDAQQAFDDFKAVVAKGDNNASAKAMKMFGKNSCGSCHKSFKKKDD